MDIVDDLNREKLSHEGALEKICAEVSDDTARVLLELARGLTGSPLGSGDGNVLRAQRLLEKRLAAPPAASPKAVVIEGRPGFQSLIAAVVAENLEDKS